MLALAAALLVTPPASALDDMARAATEICTVALIADDVRTAAESVAADELALDRVRPELPDVLTLASGPVEDRDWFLLASPPHAACSVGGPVAGVTLDRVAAAVPSESWVEIDAASLTSRSWRSRTDARIILRVEANRGHASFFVSVSGI